MTKVLIHDVSVASRNLGDSIIAEAVEKQLREIFPSAHFLNTPTHERISRKTHKLSRESEYSFVGGSNLLSSQIAIYNQWKITPIDVLFLQKPVLLGVGWWQYQNDPDWFTRVFYSHLLSKDHIHSVRDSYTADKMRAMGFPNVLNTGCPTTWDLTPENLNKVPRAKGDTVVFTLSDYNQRPELDKRLVQILVSAYAEVLFWPQGAGDEEYLRSLELVEVDILPATVSAFDRTLRSNHSIDYVGTRLHAAIRALQLSRRSICVAIDNRAIEISRDTGLTVVNRTDFSAIKKLVNSDWKTSLSIDFESIEKWKSQFG